MDFNKENAHIIFNYFRNRGYSVKACCALLGNLKPESTLLPNNLQNSYENSWKVKDAEYTRRVNEGTWLSPAGQPFATDKAGYGLAQWTSSGRKGGLLSLARKKGVSIDDILMQCEYIWNEIHGVGYAGVKAALNDGTDLDKMTRLVMTKYERPANQTEANQLARVKCAEEFYAYFTASPEKQEPVSNAGATREKVVAAMRYWEGAKDGNAKHKELINTYNTANPLPRGVKMTTSYAWCAATVSATAINCGMANTIIPIECSCGKMIALMQKMGIWQENDAYVPKPADIIFYDWSDNGIGDDVTGHDHVGIVESVTNNKITVMEGNLGGKWARRTIAVNARYIRGYGVPKYDDVAPAPTPVPITKEVWHVAALGDSVTKLAKNYGVTKESIISLNGLKAPYWLIKGKKYRVK